MNLGSRPAATMKLIAGRLCLDFVNTVSGRNPDPVRVGADPYAVIILHDKLNDYFDLLAWSHHAGLLTERDLDSLARFTEKHQVEAAAIFRRAIALREAIYRVCRASIDGKAPDEDALAGVNSELTLARQHERLSAVEASYEWVWDEPRSPDRML